MIEIKTNHREMHLKTNKKRFRMGFFMGKMRKFFRWQRGLSSFLIGALLFPSFTGPVHAGFFTRDTVPEVVNTKLVSFLVDEELLEEDFTLAGKITRFEEDIQTKLNVQAVHVPIPRDADPFEIYEGNAAFYLSGLENDGQSQLVGTILIGEVPIPVVEKKDNFWPTIYPYTDFEEMDYEYDDEKNRFVSSGNGNSQPEVWHGVIRSVEDELEDQVEELSNFFDQNHSIHSGEVDFSEKVFYADFDSQAAMGAGFLDGNYERWIKYIEDLSYSRFTKELLNDLLESFNEDLDGSMPQDYETEIANDPTGLIPDDFKLPEVNVPTEVDNSIPDIMTKFIISNYAKSYVENFKTWISQVNERVQESGRWEAGDVDTTPSLVTRKDDLSVLKIRSANDLLEALFIDELENKNVAASISVANTTNLAGDDFAEDITKDLYWYGVKRSEITVEDCSILRGTLDEDETPLAKLVEANRTYNSETKGSCEVPEAKEEDRIEDKYEGCCADNMKLSTDGETLSYERCEPEIAYWQVNTKSDDGWEHVGAELPIYDITGTNEVMVGSTGAEGCSSIIESNENPDVRNRFD
ncbi:MAG: hypothetical protein OEL89_05470, partial [Candidatus Peregrinibacteria bacterium]|nr:hypothetical protein [Candidatus Peregrinibacteria bacterium]